MNPEATNGWQEQAWAGGGDIQIAASIATANAAFPSREHRVVQRAQPGAVARVRIGAGGGQEADQVEVQKGGIGPEGQVQRGLAAVVSGVQRGAGGDQGADQPRRRLVGRAPHRTV